MTGVVGHRKQEARSHIYRPSRINKVRTRFAAAELRRRPSKEVRALHEGSPSEMGFSKIPRKRVSWRPAKHGTFLLGVAVDELDCPISDPLWLLQHDGVASTRNHHELGIGDPVVDQPTKPWTL
jgi:hypothetical protein